MTQTADNESNVQNRKKRVAFHQNNDAECKKVHDEQNIFDSAKSAYSKNVTISYNSFHIYRLFVSIGKK